MLQTQRVRSSARPGPAPCPPRRAAVRARAGLALATLLALPAASGCGSGPGSDRPRNAILISIDTLRPDHLSCYGWKRETSPTLDRLAANGARFTDVTAAAPWTLPSHTTMLTGLYPAHHGVKTHETRLAQSQVTLAEEFQQAGYQTFAVVNTWNVGAPQFQLDQGFGTYGKTFRYISETEEDPVTMQLRTHNNGKQVLAAARELLSQRDPKKPFFLFLHFYDVHTDFTPAEKYRQMFVTPYAGRMTGRTGQLISYRNRGESLTKPDVRWLKEMYDAEIRELDDQLGEFLAFLDEQGVGDDTLFVVTSDHGEEFGEHGGTLHGRTQYEEVLRIPLLIQGPGVPAGQVIDQPVSGVDVTPTILGIMGLESHMPRDGLDLSMLWKGSPTLPERLLYADSDHNNVVDEQDVSDIKKMVRQGEEKLHLDTSNGRLELYDIGSDPGEHQDLLEQRPERVRALQAALQTFLASEVRAESVAPPTREELKKLEELGYGGGGTPSPDSGKSSGQAGGE